MKILEDIYYVGAIDKDIDLFENQYRVEDGVTYNSYIIDDEKIAILDTVDKRKKDEYLENLEKVLNGRQPSYLIISHIEPDHAGVIKDVIEKYPNITLVGNSKTFPFLEQYFDLSNVNKEIVDEMTQLDLGKHKLQFIMAPMVHWPEVMMTYDNTSKTIFSADGFGRFGMLDENLPWEQEAKRYYYNIVGKYGIQVQALLNKIKKQELEIKNILPLHGPALKDNIEYYISKYDAWSKYLPDKEKVTIFCDSIHGNTMEACIFLKDMLKQKDVEVELVDMPRQDISYAVTKAFESKGVVFASSTFNMNVFVHLEHLLNLLKEKNFQNKLVGIIENGTWAPNAKNIIKEKLNNLKNITYIEPEITLRGKVKEENIKQLEELAQNIKNKI